MVPRPDLAWASAEVEPPAGVPFGNRQRRSEWVDLAGLGEHPANLGIPAGPVIEALRPRIFTTTPDVTLILSWSGIAPRHLLDFRRISATS